MAKLAETTYRDVNIALANQFARAEEVGVDIYKVIEACNSQPYSHIHRPGISVGGHCKPVYPRLYLSTDPTGGVVRAARSLNAMMPLEVLRQIEREIGPLQNKKVTLLGVTYRPGVKETAFSGAHVLAQELLSRGASVSALDPLLSNAELTAAGFEASNDYSETEIIILHTAQSEFAMLQPSDFPSLKLVFDGRNFLKESIWAGVAVVSLGRP